MPFDFVALAETFVSDPSVMAALVCEFQYAFDAGRDAGLARAEELVRGLHRTLPVYPCDVITRAIASERSRGAAGKKGTGT